jgi:V8-like Glu-specific endopeptidase
VRARRRRTRLLVTAGLFALLLAATPVTAAASDPGPGPDWSDAAAGRFWTAARMAAATPLDARPQRYATPGVRGVVRRATAFTGVPSVGVLFSLGGALRAHRCTASVVASPHHDLIVTAAHCGTGTHQAFVPMYNRLRDGRHQPYGVWAVARGWRSARYRAVGAGTDLDVAFLRVRRDAHGRAVQDRTGGNRLTRTGGYEHRVTVIGYPALTRHHTDQAVICTTGSTRLRGVRQMRIVCGGFYGGTSGAPWLVHYDQRTRTGELIGNIGGQDGGGPDDRLSYSPVYGDAVLRLYRQAAR